MAGEFTRQDLRKSELAGIFTGMKRARDAIMAELSIFDLRYTARYGGETKRRVGDLEERISARFESDTSALRLEFEELCR